MNVTTPPTEFTLELSPHSEDEKDAHPPEGYDSFDNNSIVGPRDPVNKSKENELESQPSSISYNTVIRNRVSGIYEYVRLLAAHE
jgi:hypothetical protein